jgi:hypothetical protein
VRLSVLLYVYGNKYDRHVGVTFFTMINIQLAEYIMWLDQSCGSLNHYATIYTYVMLMMQPLAILWSGYYERTLDLSYHALLLGSALIVMPWMYSIIKYVSSEKSICTKPKNGHLWWDFLSKKEHSPNMWLLITYLGGLFLPWLYLKDRTRGIFLFVLFITSSILHYVWHHNECHTQWCFSVRHSLWIYILFIVLWPRIKKMIY